MPPEPENVRNLAEYGPANRKLEVSLTFTEDAGTDMSDLMTSLGAANANEVAKRAIALLLAARGKEILLKDRQTGKVQAVEV